MISAAHSWAFSAACSGALEEAEAGRSSAAASARGAGRAACGAEAREGKSLFTPGEAGEFRGGGWTVRRGGVGGASPGFALAASAAGWPAGIAAPSGTCAAAGTAALAEAANPASFSSDRIFTAKIVCPALISSPFASIASWTRAPFKNVPLLLLRSCTRQPEALHSTAKCTPDINVSCGNATSARPLARPKVTVRPVVTVITLPAIGPFRISNAMPMPLSAKCWPTPKSVFKLR